LDNLYEKILSGDLQAIDESASFTGAMLGGGRGTFVGTPLYVAPEMLEMNLSGPFTDLWALGCIIF
jgi:serine/threonine protein kinase